MGTTDGVFNYALFTVGIILILFAAIQLVYRNKSVLNDFIAIPYVCSGFILIYSWAERTGLIFALFPLYQMVIVLAFLFAPSLYFMFRHITGLEPKPTREYLFYCLPSLVALVVILANNIAHGSMIRASRRPIVIDPVNYPWFFAIHLLAILSDIYIVFFLVRIMKERVNLYRNKNPKYVKKSRYLFACTMLFILVVVLMILAQLMQKRDMVYMTKLLAGLIFLFYIFFSFRNPEFTQRAIKEAGTTRYKFAASRDR